MSPEKEQKAQEIYKSSQSFVITLQILVSDIKFAESQLREDHQENKLTEQFWRRAIIRCVCALGEGTLNSLKGMAPQSADFFDVDLTEKEIEILTETQNTEEDGKRKPLFLPIHENFKKTVKIFTRIHEAKVDVEYGHGYEAFCNTFKLRNRLMHPRTHLDLQIKDDDYKASIQGWNWFNNALNLVLQECKKKLPYG